MKINPYEILGVSRDADNNTIKAAYRKLSAKHHPDKGGDPDRFMEIKASFDVLIDPTRRSRYDKLGRLDESAATPDRVRMYIQETMKTVVAAHRPDGSSDNPVMDNILDKILLSIAGSRIIVKKSIYETQRKVERAQRMIERFILKEGSLDLVGDALKEEKKRMEDELKSHEDALELSVEAERVFKSYQYEVGPKSEGHFNPDPTIRLSGPRNFKFY